MLTRGLRAEGPLEGLFAIHKEAKAEAENEEQEEKEKEEEEGRRWGYNEPDEDLAQSPY